MSVECFAVKHRELLELEKNAEIEETQSLHDQVPSKHLEKLGLCIRKLQASEKRSGLYGRTLVKFQPQWAGTELPAHKIFSGDIVGVGMSNDFGHREVLMSGVVWGLGSNTVTVAFEENVDAFALDDHTFYCLIKLANNVTYRRLKNILMDLQKYKGGCSSHLIDVLFGASTPSSPIVSLPNSIFCAETDSVRFRNSTLNNTQKEAVKFALCQREIAIIHGPPGTGKTTTLVEIIYQIAKQGLKLLVCAPSNVAVDNLVERLFANGLKVVRLGHPARAMQANHDLSLDAALFTCDNAVLVGDIRKEMDAILVKVGKTKDKHMRHKLRMESKGLSQELRRREKAAIAEVLQRADVVASTLTSCYTDGPLKHLAKEHFDCVVIDEVSQAIEAACWIPLLRSSRCIIAGDHLQLPPTIISKAAAKDGLEITLMERLMGLAESSSFVKMLDTQYRMHESIMRWPSDKLYGGRLIAHPSVASHLLRDIVGVEDNENTAVPLLLVDTTGCDMPELEYDDEASKGNEGEAKLVCCHVDSLVKSGVSPSDIAVITPYNLQVHILRGMLSTRYPSLEIKSVDGFQGREKEAVVMSLVRSNERREVGFLAEDRRINVAMTRARRHLAVICDGETVSRHAFLEEFVHYLSENGEVRSAQQYRDELDACVAVAPDRRAQVSKRPINKTDSSKSSSKLAVKTSSKPATSGAKSTPDTKVADKTLEETEKIRKRFDEVLKKFVADPETNDHNFPASLTALERRVVHEICEQLGLGHRSHGEKESRRIVVTKETRLTTSDAGASDAIVGGVKRRSKPADTKTTNCAVSSAEDATESSESVVNKSAGKKVKNKKIIGSDSTGNMRRMCHKGANQHLYTGVNKVLVGRENANKSATQKAKADELKVTDSSGSLMKKGNKNTTIEQDTNEASKLEVDNTIEKKVSKQKAKIDSDVRSNSTANVIHGDAKSSAEIKKNSRPIRTESAPKLTNESGLNVVQQPQAGIAGQQKKRKPKKSIKDTELQPKPDENDDEFEERVLTDAVKRNTKCNYPRCKTSTVLIRMLCDFCKGGFCLAHNIPEVHGCGEAAHVEARVRIAKEKSLVPGSGKLSHKPDPTRRIHLERKLEKKLGEMTGQRSQKSSKKDK